MSSPPAEDKWGDVFQVQSESMGSATVFHLTKYVKGISANQFWILGLPEMLICQYMLLWGHFDSGFAGLFFVVVVIPPPHSLIKENAEILLVDDSQFS